MLFLMLSATSFAVITNVSNAVSAISLLFRSLYVIYTGCLKKSRLLSTCVSSGVFFLDSLSHITGSSVQYWVTTFLEFLETWKCRRILQRSGRNRGKDSRGEVREYEWSGIFDRDTLAVCWLQQNYGLAEMQSQLMFR